MSINTPPTVFFNGINFNPAFYSIGDEAVTFKFIDANYLRSTNYAISRAAYTQFYGTIYVFNGISGSGSMLTDLNASNITSGTLTVSRGGIGTSSLNNNQLLIGNGINSLLQSSNLTWDNTSNTLSASNFVGSGSAITNLNASNITSGTLPITRGGIGTTTLSNNQLLIGNGTTSVLQTPNLSWDNTNSILYASNFVGSGSGITNINASNVTFGTLPITRGGIGTTTLTSGKLLIGNGTSALLQSSNLTWDNVNNRLGIVATVPGYTLDVLGNINCQELYRNGTTLASTLSNFLPTSGGTLTGVLSGTTISATNFSGSGSGITNINASNITSGTIGIGTTASPSIAINCYNSSSTFFQNIQMMNNASEFFYFGIAGNAAANGSYLNNFFIQASKSLVFNSTNKTHLAVPDMMIKDSTVGINTSTPNTTYKLDVSGNINGLILYEGGQSLSSKYLSSASLGNYLPLTGGTLTGTLTGTIINANTSLRIANNLVNDFCFNNLGFNHADITDFNAPVGFGCRFIFGNTNGPSVTYGAQTSSYTLFMGLGINYPASGAGSYGCQLALQRSVTNPTLSVRYKENNVWSGWSAVTAGVLRGTAILTVGTWHTSSDNQQRLYFDNNGTTFIQGQGGFPIIFRNNANADIGSVSSTGIINANLKLQEAGVDISTKYLSLSGGTMTGALNFTGNNTIKFDNTFNDKKLQLSTTSGMGLDTNGLVFYSAGVFTFKNTALTTLYSVDSGGNMSTNGIMYPAGGISSAGNVTSFGTLAGVTVTEGGTSLASKYVLLNGGNNMTGNLNIVNSGSDRSVRISATSIEALNAAGTANRLLAVGNSGGIAMGGFLSYGITTARHAIDMYNASILIRGSSEASQAILYICNPYLQDSALKTAIIAQGVGSWSRSKLMFCLNSTADNTSPATITDAKLTIDTNGNVGIGNTAPAYPLVVSGTTNSFTVTSMSRRYDEIGSIGNTTPYTMPNIVAYLNGNVLTPGFYVSFSDERLKKEIEDLSNDFALQTIMKLKPIKYNLIDNIYNNNVNYGFSAQEVQKVLPEAVISAKHYLPNIYQNVDKVDNANSNIMIDAKIIGSNLNVNDNIRIITHSNEEQIKKIVSIKENVITLDSKIDNYNDGEPLFLYGKEEENIRCVNHNFLYNVNIKATQVLYEIIMKQQQEIEKLTNALISSNIISPL